MIRKGDRIIKWGRKIDIFFMDATAIAQQIRERKLSSARVVEAFLAQIEQSNPAINAVVTLDAEGARKAAVQADEGLLSGKVNGPLHGVPITIKDSFETAGMHTTSGKPASDHIPTKDATVVVRLKAAGAIVMGKTNLPEFFIGLPLLQPDLWRHE
jgi:amidase